MVKAILFDLFETLITESGTRPAGVSSLGSSLGCERDAFRAQWKRFRPSVTIGRLSLQQALIEITTGLRGVVDATILQQLCDERARAKAIPFGQSDRQFLDVLDSLRMSGIRLGVVSNCFAEDVVAWPRSPLASRFDCKVFSFEVGLAKPDAAIYREATHRLGADVSDTWFIGDGGDDELSGAERAGLRALRATWFLRQWPHFRDEPTPASIAQLTTPGEILQLLT